VSRGAETNVSAGADVTGAFTENLKKMARNSRSSWLRSCWLPCTVRSHYWRFATITSVLSLALLWSAPVGAEPLTLTAGVFSYDAAGDVIPPEGTSAGVDAFNISNITGLGIDLDGFGVIVPALDFSDLVITLFDANGQTSTPLGGLAANSVLADATGFSPLLFPDTQAFTSATLTGTIGGFSTQLSETTVFTADPSTFLVTLTPSNLVALVAGSDFVPITITGELTTSTVPEPSTLALLAAGLAITARRRRTSARS